MGLVIHSSNPNQVSLARSDLPGAYRELLEQNPLLGRIEGHCRTIGWTDEEIRTMQLLVACRSNASMKERIQQLERSIAILK